VTQPPSNNSLVSVRIPKSLFLDLQKLAKKNHYLDVSEQVRSIVRNRWQEAKDPQAYQVKRLRAEITQALRQKRSSKTQEALVKELEKIKDNLLGEEHR
jgi:Arc/MetJ-type ribon-helix-helix transcriptional regulator